MIQTLKNLGSEELIRRVKSLVENERSITVKIIEHLEEIESRKLHHARGYSDLREFCIQELNYSESQAHRRISAMWLTRELPETKSAIEEGRLTLATVSMAQTFFRQEKKQGEKAYTVQEKRELLGELQGKSKREAERVLLEKSTVSMPAPISYEKPVRHGGTRLEVTLSDEQMSKLKLLQEIWSHSIREGDWVAVIEKMAEIVLDKVDPDRQTGGSTRGATREARVYPA